MAPLRCIFDGMFDGLPLKSDGQYNGGDIAALERSCWSGCMVRGGWTEENAGIARKRISLTSRMLESGEF